jgi:hypothetical protein
LHLPRSERGLSPRCRARQPDAGDQAVARDGQPTATVLVNRPDGAEAQVALGLKVEKVAYDRATRTNLDARPLIGARYHDSRPAAIVREKEKQRGAGDQGGCADLHVMVTML